MKIWQAALLSLTATETLAFAPSKTSLASPRAPRTQTAIRLEASDFSNGLRDVFSVLDDGLKNAVGNLDKINVAINEKNQELLRTFLKEVQTALNGETALQQEVTKYLTSFTQQIDEWLANQNPAVESFFKSTLNQLSAVSINTPEAIAITTIITFFIVSSVLTWGEAPPPSRPYPLQKYDPIAAQAYFDGKTFEFVSRALQIAIKSLGFGIKVLQDQVSGTSESKAEQRGMELAKLLTELGPTFIKIGQSLSIRTDLLSPAYIRGLASLQDKVTPFSTKVAKEILEEEWGQPVYSVLSKISDEPVAAASLGQVYKATMKDGREVAVKVQRPNIMNQIALDMHLLREFAPVAKRTFNLNTDTVGTVDAWGTGFVDELDYIQEAENGKYFMSKIQDTPLKNVVMAPEIVDELSTPKVLVSEWVDGERLDKSSSEDITILCSICMNTYLTMLLELGLLHSDPHPGNLLRTPEGKLCILDWGMVTRLPPELQLTLIEHMAHLTSSDYAEVPRDLLLLGFIPPSKADAIEDSGVVEVLADIYGQWTAGGGAAAINVNEVINNLQDLTAEKGNLFQIPPYFAYIAKSFSVLEGIGLSNDPKYSIINECLPYVSNRLLTDKENMGPALSTFIFGPNKGNVETRIVDYDRVEQLVTGFGSFSTSASGALLGKENLTRTQKLEEAADQVLDIIVTEEKTPVQEILLEQLAKIVSAGSRSLWTQARERSGTLPSGRTLLGTIVDPLGLFESSPLVNSNDQDQKTVETTRKLVSLMSEQLSASENSIDLSDLKRDEVLELATILGKKVWDRRFALFRTGSRFATKLLEVTAHRLETSDRVARKKSLPEQPEKTMLREAVNEEKREEGRISSRLSKARNTLDALEREDTATIVEEAVPVRTAQ